MLILLIRRLVLAVSIIVLASCKLNVIVPHGGFVESDTSSLRGCDEANVCEIEITDPNFVDAFTALAKPGYRFVRWQAGEGFLCGDSTLPRCAVEFNGSDLYVFAVATRGTSYIMPVFEDVGVDTDEDGMKDHLDDDDDNDGLLDGDDPCPRDATPNCGTGSPIVDTIGIELAGKQWAQPDLFTNLSWNDFNAACPAGECIEGRVLNGHDMTGWTWASLEDVNDLFTSYVVRPPISGKDGRLELDSNWAPDFFSDGWRPTAENAFSKFTHGTTWSRNEPGFFGSWTMRYYSDPGTTADFAGWGSGIGIDTPYAALGAWFYR